MDITIFLAVLAGAAMHAAWNAVLTFGDRWSALALIALGHGTVALLTLPFVGLPHQDALPFLALSTLLHVGYRIFLVKAYEQGDMSQVYPLARGSAPLLTTLVGLFWFGETVAPLAALGILVIGVGIVLMSMKGSADLSRMSPHALGFAGLTAVFIAAYTLADGFGGRAAQNPHAYAAWLFVIDTPVTLAVAYAVRGRALFTNIQGQIGKGLLGGALSLGSYWIAIWAMSQAPIPQVAALRETSVLFGVLIAVLLLGEAFTRYRMLAALLIVSGAALMRLA